MLGLPQSTKVNRRISKEKLYANAKPTATVKDLIKNQIESVVWRNKLAENTLNIAAGERIEEIQVFEVAIRQKDLDKRVLPTIAKSIPYKILFLLTYQGKLQAWMEVTDTFYCTDWFLEGNNVLTFEGLNLDAVYQNLARQIAGGRLDGVEDLVEAVERDKRRQKLEREIAALEKKIMKEKQFNKQVEMSGELKALRAEFEGFG